VCPSRKKKVGEMFFGRVVKPKGETEGRKTAYGGGGDRNVLKKKGCRAKFGKKVFGKGER